MREKLLSTAPLSVFLSALTIGLFGGLFGGPFSDSSTAYAGIPGSPKFEWKVVKPVLDDLSKQIEVRPPSETFSLNAGAYSYASDANLNDQVQQRFDLELKRDFFRAWGFYESGGRGTYGFDLDPIRARIELPGILSDKPSQLWMGRVQPLEELRGSRPSAFSALGISMAQNQLDPIHPSVSGWAGIGGSVTITDHLNFFALGSPLFIPNRSPSLGIDKYGKSNPTRFTRTLPSSVQAGDLEMPIVYNIETGSLKKILLQNQAMVGLRAATSDIDAGVLAWTAPDPTPTTTIDWELLLDAKNEKLDTKVNARPSFPRRNRGAGYLALTSIYGSPEIQYQRLLNASFGNHEQFGSVSWTVLPGLQVSYLNRFAQKKSNEASMADGMVGLNAGHKLFKKFLLDQVLQTTTTPGRNSFRLSERLTYLWNENFQIYAGFSALSGEDNSWFGEWRSEDSIYGGIRCVL